MTDTHNIEADVAEAREEEEYRAFAAAENLRVKALEVRRARVIARPCGHAPAPLPP
jgi:hypothetical protein